MTMKNKKALLVYLYSLNDFFFVRGVGRLNLHIVYSHGAKNLNSLVMGCMHIQIFPKGIYTTQLGPLCLAFLLGLLLDGSPCIYIYHIVTKSLTTYRNTLYN